jgi:uncharacterized membrane protein
VTQWGTARTEAFSDGVIAIAITLLVLDIRVPPSDFSDLWRGILDQWPAYLGYATSFLTIDGIWLAHHGVFGRLEYVTKPLMRINLVLLMAIAFLPFPTRLMAEAIDSDDAERAAVVFYGASLFVISLLLFALWATVARDPSLLRSEVSESELRALVRSATPSLGFYVVLAVVAILFPVVAVFGYLGIAIMLVLAARGDRRLARATRAA